MEDGGSGILTEHGSRGLRVLGGIGMSHPEAGARLRSCGERSLLRQALHGSWFLWVVFDEDRLWQAHGGGGVACETREHPDVESEGTLYAQRTSPVTGSGQWYWGLANQ